MHRTVVTIPTAQWSLYAPHSGHYTYRTAVTICTAQRSLYVPHSGHYMHHTVVTICTAQWSLYVPHSGHYMHRTVVTIRTAQRLLYVRHSSHYVYRQFDIQQFHVPPTQLYLCVLCGSQNKQRLFPYTALTDWFLSAFAKLPKATISFVMSVRLAELNNSAPRGRIFVKLLI